MSTPAHPAFGSCHTMSLVSSTYRIVSPASRCLWKSLARSGFCGGCSIGFMPLDSSWCVWRDSNSQALCAPRFELGVFTCFTTNTRTPQQWFHCCGVTSPSIRSRGGTFEPPLSILPLVTNKVAATAGSPGHRPTVTGCCWSKPRANTGVASAAGCHCFWVQLSQPPSLSRFSERAASI